MTTNMSENDLQRIVESAIESYEKRKSMLSDNAKSYSIAKVAQKLGRSHTTIKNLVKAGKLKTTSDGRRITHQALQDYLGSEPK